MPPRLIPKIQSSAPIPAASPATPASGAGAPSKAPTAAPVSGFAALAPGAPKAPGVPPGPVPPAIQTGMQTGLLGNGAKGGALGALQTGAPGAAPGGFTSPFASTAAAQTKQAMDFFGDVADRARPQTFPGGSDVKDLPTAPPPEDTRTDWEKMYDDLISAHDSQAAQERDEISRNGQLALHSSQRGADLLNARLGRSIAGGYAGLQAQATIGGMESIRKALAEQSLRSGDKRRNLLLDKLNTGINERHRSEDRQHDLDLAAIGQEPVPGMGPGKELAKLYDDQHTEITQQLSPADQAAYEELVAKWKTGEVTNDELKAFLDERGVEYTNWAEHDASTQERNRKTVDKFFNRVATRNRDDSSRIDDDFWGV